MEKILIKELYVWRFKSLAHEFLKFWKGNKLVEARFDKEKQRG
jgi:hypothetical protein